MKSMNWKHTHCIRVTEFCCSSIGHSGKDTLFWGNRDSMEKIRRHTWRVVYDLGLVSSKRTAKGKSKKCLASYSQVVSEFCSRPTLFSRNEDLFEKNPIFASPHFCKMFARVTFNTWDGLRVKFCWPDLFYVLGKMCDFTRWINCSSLKKFRMAISRKSASKCRTG